MIKRIDFIERLVGRGGLFSIVNHLHCHSNRDTNKLFLCIWTDNSFAIWCLFSLLLFFMFPIDEYYNFECFFFLLRHSNAPSDIHISEYVWEVHFRFEIFNFSFGAIVLVKWLIFARIHFFQLQVQVQLKLREWRTFLKRPIPNRVAFHQRFREAILNPFIFLFSPNRRNWKR